MYCHIGSQRGRVPTQVWAGRPGSEGSMGGAGSSRMKMWSSLGQMREVTHLRPSNLSLVAKDTQNCYGTLTSWATRFELGIHWCSHKTPHHANFRMLYYHIHYTWTSLKDLLKCLDLLKLRIVVQCPGRFLYIPVLGQNPSVSKSRRLHDVIFWVYYLINSRYIP